MNSSELARFITELIFAEEATVLTALEAGNEDMLNDVIREYIQMFYE